MKISKISKNNLIAMTVLLSAFSLFGDSRTVAYAQTPGSVDSTEIMTRFFQFQEAIQKRDSVSIADFYFSDAVSLLQNQPVRQGRSAIAARWAKVLAGPFIFQVLSPELSVSPSRCDAFQFGRFEIHSADTSNALMAAGKVMFVWRKQIDRWRIALEMDNFDRPPAPPNKE